MKELSRRTFLKTAAISTSAVTLTSVCSKTEVKEVKKSELRLGLMTYNLGKDWDIDTVIKNCTETKWEGVELRTTHAHKVEVNLTPQQRAEVKKKFEYSPVRLAGLASGFMYHMDNPAELRKNIEGTKEYVVLARDVGAEGIRVFPNSLMVDKGIPEEQTLEQIGKSLKEVGEFAKDYGVKIKLCTHGGEVARIPRIKKIMDYADNDNVVVNWNCNKTDEEDGGLVSNFNLIRPKIFSLHMHELWSDYPYRELFKLMIDSGFNGYCFAEISESTDPIRLMHYYRGLFLALQNII
jgi:sugar phosphate isomerase/epimerase